MEQLEERLRGLSAEKRRLLEALQSVDQEYYTSIPRADRTRDLPLSYGQERLWFLDQLVPNRASYSLPRAVRLTGPLKVEVLERAINEIIRRHECLRTRFESVLGNPRQVIVPHLRLDLSVEDLTGYAEGAETHARKLAHDHAYQPFNLATGPLIRAKLLRLADDDHVLLLLIHHIVGDGWSYAVLIREMSTLYAAFLEGKPSPLPELKIQYADYAVWQRNWLSGAVLEDQLNYWRRQLSDAAVLELRTDFRRPLQLKYEGATTMMQLSHELSEALRQLSRQEGTTLFMTLLAGFNVLMRRYSGSNDIVLGSPIANRSRAEVEPLIGFFVNTLALRTNLGGNPTVRALLQRVKDVCLGAYGHQDLPFEKLVSELEPVRETSRNPVTQILFAGQNWQAATLALTGLNVTGFLGRETVTRFDQEWSVHLQSPNLRVFVNYSTELFTANTLGRMFKDWEDILRAFVEDPEQRINDLLTARDKEQRSRLEVQDNEEKDGGCIQEWFERQAQLRPGNTALVYGAEQLSYGELNRRANQLAHQLRGLGVGPEVKVGLCLERSVEMVVGMLGVLKAGGAYVPFDPSYPVERLTYMLEDSRASVLVAQRGVADELTKQSSKVLFVDSQAQEIGEQSEENPRLTTSGRNLAYVIYTSGSTGQPKGVEIEHRNVTRLFSETQPWFGFGESDVWTLFHSYAFDVSVWEAWGALLFGGKLIIVSYLQSRSPELFYDLLETEGVTVLSQTPSAFRQLIEVDERRPVPLNSLRLVILGGEALDPGMLGTWMDQHPRTEIINMYGITEITVHGTYKRMERSDVEGNGSPIGVAIPDLQLYVMDEEGRPVPLGSAGELYVGGAGLARGYLNRPALTAERFVANPFSAKGERLYKSGDRVRQRGDGSFEFLGRIDQQVKIRGYRIELGEIEAVLRQQPSVSNACVTVNNETGTPRLLAYVTLRQADQKGSSALESTVRNSHVYRWEGVFDRTYAGGSADDQKEFNISGWNSSYTGRPLSKAEMRDWLDHTLERLREVKAKRILEIGCGTGLILFGLAPECESYVGTDISQAALDTISEQLRNKGDLARKVRLVRAPADELTSFEDHSVDLVIINSVAQYFPDLAYFLGVLKQATRLLANDGVIFLGDLRSLPLLKPFHAEVALERANPAWNLEEVCQLAAKGVEQESELLIGPGMFQKLRHCWAGIGSVSVCPKRSAFHNELTQFRYDVLIRLGPGHLPERPDWEEWKPGTWSVSATEEYLLNHKPRAWGLRNVANARVARALRIASSLDQPDAQQQTVDGLRQSINGFESESVDPEEWWQLHERTGMNVEISWVRGGEEGKYDVLFRDQAKLPAHSLPVSSDSFFDEDNEVAPGGEVTLWTYANNPLKITQEEEVIHRLRRHVKDKLPDYMAPAAYVVLDSMPLTPNGKVDRKALPKLDTARPQLLQEFVPAENQVQEALARIWAQVLKLDKVGINDNFFELGGDSIHSVQAVARANEEGIPVTVKQFFQNQTIAQLTESLSTAGNSLTNGASPRAGMNNGRDEAKRDISSSITTVDNSEIAQYGDVESVLPLAPGTEYMFRRYVASAASGLPMIQAILPAGNLNVESFRRIWQTLVDRHSALRTAIVTSREARHVHVVFKHAQISMENRDLRNLGHVERQKAVRNYLAEDRALGFDPSSPQSLRMMIMRLTERHSFIILTINYVMMDGWSMRLLMDEMQFLIKQERAATPGQLPDPIPYERYLEWISQRNLGAARSFWTSELKDFVAQPRLADRASKFWSETLLFARRSASEVFSGRTTEDSIATTHHTLLSATATAAAYDFAKRNRLTLSTVSSAAWAICLARIIGADDVLFAVGSSARPAQVPGIERMMGRTLNPLPMRVAVRASAQRATEWLQELQAQQVEMREYEYVGLHEILEWAGMPVADVPETYLVFQNLGSLSLGGRRVDTAARTDVLGYTQKYIRDVYPLRIDIYPENQLFVMLTFVPSIYDHVTAACILDLFMSQLEFICSQPDCTLSDWMALPIDSL